MRGRGKARPIHQGGLREKDWGGLRENKRISIFYFSKFLENFNEHDILKVFAR